MKFTKISLNKIQYVVVLVWAIVLLNACSTLKITESFSTPPELRDTISEVFFFSNSDSVPYVEIVSEFVLKEDWTVSWSYNRNRLKEFAKRQSCNGIIIQQIGQLKGHGLYVKGKLFYLDHNDLDSIHGVVNNKECELVIVREFNKNMLTSNYQINIKIEDKLYNYVKPGQTIIYAAIDCDTLKVTVNNKAGHIHFNSSNKRYFKVDRLTGSTVSAGGGVGIMLGGAYVTEYEDHEYARLVAGQYLQPN